MLRPSLLLGAAGGLLLVLAALWLAFAGTRSDPPPDTTYSGTLGPGVLVDGARVYLPTPGAVSAHDVSSGQRSWTYSGADLPLLANDRLVLVHRAERGAVPPALVALDPQTGAARIESKDPLPGLTWAETGAPDGHLLDLQARLDDRVVELSWRLRRRGLGKHDAPGDTPVTLDAALSFDLEAGAVTQAELRRQTRETTLPEPIRRDLGPKWMLSPPARAGEFFALHERPTEPPLDRATIRLWTRAGEALPGIPVEGRSLSLIFGGARQPYALLNRRTSFAEGWEVVIYDLRSRERLFSVGLPRPIHHFAVVGDVVLLRQPGVWQKSGETARQRPDLLLGYSTARAENRYRLEIAPLQGHGTFSIRTP